MTSEVIGVINSNITRITKNEQTKIFVGKSIVRRKTDSGQTVYQIAQTSYILTPDELDFFIKNGAIKVPTMPMQDKNDKRTHTVQNNVSVSSTPSASTPAYSKPNNVEVTDTPLNSNYNRQNVINFSSGVNEDPQITSYPVAQASSQKQNRQQAIPPQMQQTPNETAMNANPPYQSQDDNNQEDFTADTMMMSEALETSDFFNYNPQFDLSAPRHSGILDIKETALRKIDKAVDRFGFNVKEMIIRGLEKERCSLDNEVPQAQNSMNQ